MRHVEDRNLKIELRAGNGNKGAISDWLADKPTWLARETNISNSISAHYLHIMESQQGCLTRIYSASLISEKEYYVGHARLQRIRTGNLYCSYPWLYRLKKFRSITMNVETRRLHSDHA